MILSIILAAQLSFAATAPKYGPNATPLSAQSNTEYFQKNKAPDYWSLSPYYIPQENPMACSAANISMILNAARTTKNLSASDKLITSRSFAEEFAEKSYCDAVLQRSFNPGTSFSNRNLARQLGLALEKLKLKTNSTQINFKSGASRKEFIEDLARNERTADDFVFFSFMQGKVTGDPEGDAHVATVGAFDAKKNLVLVLDPDREYYEPYWTPVSVLFDAINDSASDSRKEPGWIYVKIR